MSSLSLLRSSLLYVVVAVLAVMPVAAQALPESQRALPRATPLAQCLSRIQEFLGVPGMLLMMKNHSAAVGVRSISPRVPLTPNDAYRIGSVTKMFTATLILLLVKDGELSLSDKMVDILGPERVSMIPNADQVTVQMLLQMTSGIAEYNTEEFREVLYANPGRDWTPDQILRSLPDTGGPTFFAPNASCAECGEYCYQGGSCWKYANTNYLLLGMIAEQVTNQRIEELYRERIFKPLHMTHTYMATSNEFPKVHARGYMTMTQQMDCPVVEARGFADFYDVTECFEPDAAWSAGAIISDADDMKIWLEEMATGSLIGPELQQQRMQTIAGVHGGVPIEYGLGVMVAQLPGAPTIIGHAGEFFGFANLAFYFEGPQGREHVIGMVNGTGGSVDYRFDLLTAAISHSFGQLHCPR
ncbi:MAG TPA: serine hydrolase domain-containing protein [Thermoanaerobaculia bacterium]|nr:serine hydrolase domain-containing protein [Thermoanaerobaculia bacterium]